MNGAMVPARVCCHITRRLRPGPRPWLLVGHGVQSGPLLALYWRRYELPSMQPCQRCDKYTPNLSLESVTEGESFFFSSSSCKVASEFRVLESKRYNLLRLRLTLT